MLRITNQGEQCASTQLRVEGRITSGLSQELERACRMVLREGKSVLLDFSDVSFIDRGGAEMLRGLLTDGVSVINASRLIRELLPKEQ